MTLDPPRRSPKDILPISSNVSLDSTGSERLNVRALGRRAQTSSHSSTPLSRRSTCTLLPCETEREHAPKESEARMDCMHHQALAVLLVWIELQDSTNMIHVPFPRHSGHAPKLGSKHATNLSSSSLATGLSPGRRSVFACGVTYG